MSWTAGTFSRADGSSGCANDAAASIGIEASKMDDRLNDLSTGINSTLNKAGQNSPSAHLGWLDTHFWGGTSGGTANAQTVTVTPAITALTVGCSIKFKVGTTNTAACTLSVNELTAKEIRKLDGKAVGNNDLLQNSIVEVTYDGTYWILTSQRNIEQLAQFFATGINGTGSGFMSVVSGINSIVIPTNMITLIMTLALNANITSGSFTYILNKNGSSTGQQGVITSSSAQIINMAATSYAAADILQMAWSSSSVVGPTTALVTVWGA